MVRLPLSAAALLLAAAPPSAAFTTTAPLDVVQRCLTTQLAQSGRPTAINSAAGVVLDLSFQSVGAGGKVVSSHVAFAIDDLGTQRRVSVATPDGPDGVLAQQMLREMAHTCLPEDDAPAAE